MQPKQKQDREQKRNNEHANDSFTTGTCSVLNSNPFVFIIPETSLCLKLHLQLFNLPYFVKKENFETQPRVSFIASVIVLLIVMKFAVCALPT